MKLAKAAILFGSCNRQNLPQSFWRGVNELGATDFVWMGDAVYAANNSLAGLRSAYELMETSSEYSAFRAGVLVDGVWDDHDLGVNDGGKNTADKQARQNMYLDFLNGDGKNEVLVPLRRQEGLYHYRDISVYGTGKIIRLVFLDTRTHRDSTWVKSFGESGFPLSALVAATVRLITALFGMGQNYAGDVLGELQWKWLEQTLRTSNADYHVMISSIQVLTTNPVIESWGHFPVAKNRLLDLLLRVNPKGFLITSGDVHFAEISKLDIKNKETNEILGSIIEVTSSGLTHSCETSRVVGWLCPIMVDLFDEHRAFPASVYTGRNIALLNVNETNAILEICSLQNDKSVCGVLVHVFSPNSLYSGDHAMKNVVIDTLLFYRVWNYFYDDNGHGTETYIFIASFLLGFLLLVLLVLVDFPPSKRNSS